MKKTLALVVLFLSMNNILFAKTKLDQFTDYKRSLYNLAVAKDFGEYFLDNVFLSIKYNTKFAKADKKQFKKQTFSKYYNKAINHQRIKNAREVKKNNQTLLSSISKKYSVPSEYIIALWAIESSLGKRTGKNVLVNSLANLAFEGRRRALFEKEFLASLEILRRRNIDAELLKGSWAGATGQTQFLPTTYLENAVDYNKDGFTDIWRNKKDIYASIANYLKNIGWNKKLPVALKLRLRPYQKRDLNKKFILAKLLKKYKIISDFTKAELNSTVKIMKFENTYYLIFENFKVIKMWNNSSHFALMIGLFANKLIE